MLSTRVRWSAAGAVALIAALGVPQAGATPYAGQYRYLDASTVAIAGTDGARWLLSVEATESDGVGNRPEQFMYVDLSRCTGSTCVSRGSWVRPLTAAEISVSPDFVSGRLRTVLGGLPLDIALRHDGPVGPGATNAGPVVVGGPAPLDLQPGVNAFYDGTGTFSLGKASCSATGYTGAVVQADSVGRLDRERRTAPPARLPSAIAGARALSC